MTARERWSQGLQWGGCAWLGYIAWQGSVDLYQVHGNPLPCLPGCWYSLLRWLAVLAMLGALALIALGSGWSRAMVGAVIFARLVNNSTNARSYDEITPLVVLGEFLALSPLLPLVLLRVGEPRLVLALLALGRWREALARSGGLRTALIAAAVVSLHRGARAAFASFPDYWPHRVTKALEALGFDPYVWTAYVWTGAMLPVILFALAALATWAIPPRATTTRTSS
jgi:hypothetical protein